MKKRILILLALILIPISANAASMNISCTSGSIAVGGTVKCSIKGQAPYIGGGEGKIDISGGTIESYSVGTCVTLGSDAVSKSEFTCVNEMNPNSVTFVTYVLKADKPGTMTFTVSDASIVAGQNFDTVNIGTLSKNISVTNPVVPSQPTTKQTQPATQPTTRAPQVQPGTTQGTTQAPTPGEPTTQAPVEEPTTTTEPVTEEVTSAESNPRTDSNSLLATLTIKGIKFDFNSNKFEYNIEVTSDIKDLEFSYKPYMESANVNISSTKLVDGMNNIEIVVSYEGETTTYKLNINKKVKKDSKKAIIKVAKIVGSLAGMLGLTYILIVVIKK
jgi:hypothetical protein